MTWRTIAGALAVGLLTLEGVVGGGASTVEAQNSDTAQLMTVTVFDVPNATNTFPLDVNADGVVVGRYLLNGRTHGFVRSSSGDITTIDVPGAVLTVAAAINDPGVIVGQYAPANAPNTRHGFILQDGVFTTFDPPGSAFTNALGINERGDIVGRYCTLVVCGVTGSGSFHGFVLSNGVFSAVDVPDSRESDAFGINSSDQIAGGYLTADRQERIFVLTNGDYTTLAVPGHAVSLDKGGINERGEIVGVYCDFALPCGITRTGTHGFLFDGGGLTTIDISGASATAAIGINAAGDIVGSYFDSHGAHGFLMKRAGR